MKNVRQPLYIRIQEHFKELIRYGELKKGDKIPTEKKLMEQFGVSRITVANALAELAKDDWIYRVPGRGSFVKGGQLTEETNIKEHAVLTEDNKHASQTSCRKMIGLVISSMEDLFAIRLIKGIREVLDGDKYYLTIVVSDNSKEMEQEMIRELIKKGTAGLIIFPVDAETYNEEILSLKVNKFPFVLVDRYLPGVDTHLVCSDSYTGTKLAIDHLWELGHKEIAICSDSPLPTMTVSDRISGYIDALKAKKALINPSHILTDFTIDYSDIDKKHPLYGYLKGEIVTAFITLNARLGLYLKHMANQIGLKVPEDVSILTFDDPSLSFGDFERYTHINQWEKSMGRQSAEILMNVIDHPEQLKDDYQKVILEPKLIVGHSTGAAKIKK